VASTSDDLFGAIDAGDAATVVRLVSVDPSLASAPDAEGVSALLRARYRSDDAMVAAIREHVADLDVFEAAALGDEERVEALAAADPSLALEVSGDGFTALHLAAFFDGPVVARTLLDAGAIVDAPGTGWMTGTALHSAAAARNLAVADVLLAAGADVDARQAQGWTALHSAANNGDLAMIDRLLAAGADASATNDEGRTPADLTDDEAVLEALA
jgi:adenosylhomocysteine nucleosidase